MVSAQPAGDSRFGGGLWQNWNGLGRTWPMPKGDISICSWNTSGSGMSRMEPRTGTSGDGRKTSARCGDPRSSHLRYAGDLWTRRDADPLT